VFDPSEDVFRFAEEDAACAGEHNVMTAPIEKSHAY
jgi:hypothetical protein